MLIKIISFVYPYTRKVKSEFSGDLELTTVCGKKVLDTRNTNYSYGSLQRVLKYSLQQLDLNNTGKVLLLGLGGGSVIRTLRDSMNYTGELVAVDIDPVIIDIARQEFHVVEGPDTKIICADAFQFVENEQSGYDLVIVDLFIDNVVPDKFLDTYFWRKVLGLLNENGDVIFNTLCSPATNIQSIEEKLTRRGIEYIVHRYVEKTNKVLIAHNG